MSDVGGLGGFEALENMDAIALAKEVQWEIEMTEDPTEASLKSGMALSDIYKLDDRRFRIGSFLTVHTLGAYIMDVPLADGQRATAQLDGMVVQGRSAGIGFIQNIGKPRIQTLYLALREARTLESRSEEDGIWVSRLGTQPLVVPVLNIDAITVPAA